MAKDIEGETITYGDRVVVAFKCVGTHGDVVALEPEDKLNEKHPVVSYTSRLCKKTRPTATVEQA